MLVLGIETSCDETACAIVQNGTKILSNVVSTQIDLHAQYGGVVPELACRRHADILIPVLDRALKEANVSLSDIHRIAVANTPGLIGALLIGVNAAKALAMTTNLPLVAVNHVEAHLYASMMPLLQEGTPLSELFPALGVVISGGHTFLAHMESASSYKILGKTVDDAMGEAFDKVACILGLSYPGGPKIEQLAKTGNPDLFPLKPGRVKERPLDFSFSGLKTNVLYLAKGQGSNKHSVLQIGASDKNHLAASFQKVAFDDLVTKIRLTCQQALTPYKYLVFGGGVSCNLTLRETIQQAGNLPPALWPPKGLALDNAAMIAGLAYHLVPEPSPLHLEAKASFFIP